MNSSNFFVHTNQKLHLTPSVKKKSVYFYVIYLKNFDIFILSSKFNFKYTTAVLHFDNGSVDGCRKINRSAEGNQTIKQGRMSAVFVCFYHVVLFGVLLFYLCYVIFFTHQHKQQTFVIIHFDIKHRHKR